jgi:hypothetical protein
MACLRPWVKAFFSAGSEACVFLSACWLDTTSALAGHRYSCAICTLEHSTNRQLPGALIPEALPAQLGLDSKAGAGMTIEDGALVLRAPASPARTGWAEAARRIAEAGDGCEISAAGLPGRTLTRA